MSTPGVSTPGVSVPGATVPEGGVRIAMWSGPRNISTAMMRAWENRADTAVIDEPFYACYLNATGLPHPGREDVLAAQPTDWRRVVETVTGPIPGGRAIFYQKHMTHHMVPEIGRRWLGRVVNAFLIREPARVLASYVQLRGAVTADDVGYAHQRAIFEQVRAETGRTPPVLDAADVLANPREMLTGLCEAIGVPFSEAMLAWPPGPRSTDGVWAPHWYANVERSTGFAPPVAGEPPPLPESLRSLAAACEEHYRVLHAVRLRPRGKT